jgi:hypothetical protein
LPEARAEDAVTVEDLPGLAFHWTGSEPSGPKDIGHSPAGSDEAPLTAWCWQPRAPIVMAAEARGLTKAAAVFDPLQSRGTAVSQRLSGTFGTFTAMEYRRG